jgi:hypothetical protein
MRILPPTLPPEVCPVVDEKPEGNGLPPGFPKLPLPFPGPKLPFPLPWQPPCPPEPKLPGIIRPLSIDGIEG